MKALPDTLLISQNQEGHLKEKYPHNKFKFMEH